jgi:hypothetical protein
MCAWDEGFVNIIEILSGVIIGAAIPLIKDWLAARRAEKIERIKLHDAQRIKAYQMAYEFSSALRLSLKDKSQDKDLSFINGCAAKLYAVNENLPYYSKSVRSSLIELEGIMETVVDSIMDKESNSDLINKKVPPISERLRGEILYDFRIWE